MTINRYELDDEHKVSQEDLQTHMEMNPFSAKCEECGADLEIKRSVDLEFDVSITVTPCEKCLKLAKEEGYDDGLSDGSEAT